MAISSLNEIRQGMNLDINGEPYRVVESNFLRMQQRKPVMQTKLKNLINGKVLEISFKPGDKIEQADLSRDKVTFLYADENQATFMDSQTYEQFFIDKSVVAEELKFLVDGKEVDILKFKGNPVAVQLPPKVELKVVEAPPGIKGDTAGSATKQIKVETGYMLTAPLFIKEGDMIRINTETGQYAERV